MIVRPSLDGSQLLSPGLLRAHQIRTKTTASSALPELGRCPGPTGRLRFAPLTGGQSPVDTGGSVAMYNISRRYAASAVAVAAAIGFTALSLSTPAYAAARTADGAS